MTAKTRRTLLYLGPAISSLAVIVVASNLPASAAPRIPLPHLDKFIHFSMFMMLGLTWPRALSAIGWPSKAIVVPATILFAALIGIADEVHQSFSPGRDASVFDWVADVLGATSGAILWMVCRRLRKARCT